MVGYDPSKRRLPDHAYGVAGAASGIFTRCVAQPLDVLKIRFQLQVEPVEKGQGSKYHNIPQAVRAILKEEGVRAFWKGLVPAQFLSVAYGSVQFVGFEVLTKHAWEYLPSYFTTDYKYLTHFVCGGACGSLATLAGQPFDVIRTRLVAQGEPKLYRNMMHAAESMLRTEGPMALYKGLTPTLLQIGPQTGLHFGFYSFFRALWLNVFGEQQEEVFASNRSLVCGAGAGFSAKIIIYPLDLIKKRLQIQGFGCGRISLGHTDKYTGFLDCVRTIAGREGVKGFYKGLTPSLIKAVVTASVQFWSYEWCCHLWTIYYS